MSRSDYVIVKESNYTVVSELLKCGYRNIDSKNQDGQTAVHLACLHADDKILQKLIERGANINSRDAKGNTPLHYACAKRTGLEMVRMLVEASANLQARNSETGLVPLHEAAENGNLDAIQELLRHRVPHRPRTNYGEMPADLARQRGHYQVVEFLNAYEPLRPQTYRDLWYHGTLERTNAVDCLKEAAAKRRKQLQHGSNKENSECAATDQAGHDQFGGSGTYLVRYSAKQNVDVLTMLYESEPKHFIIQRQQDWLYIDEGPYMDSLEHLIDHYIRFSDGLPINLRFPVTPGPKPPIPAFGTMPKTKQRMMHRAATDSGTNGSSLATGLTSMFRKSSEGPGTNTASTLPAKGPPSRNLSVPNDAMLQMNRVGLFDRSPERCAPDAPRRVSKGSPNVDEGKAKPNSASMEQVGDSEVPPAIPPKLLSSPTLDTLNNNNNNNSAESTIPDYFTQSDDPLHSDTLPDDANEEIYFVEAPIPATVLEGDAPPPTVASINNGNRPAPTNYIITKNIPIFSSISVLNVRVRFSCGYLCELSNKPYEQLAMKM
uniref:SH2 domain-containing protein n=1 Tax=Anopheles dirus TaxID=7168 RepID=A0A182N2M8_9DIPT